jgi:hypothetical protein
MAGRYLPARCRGCGRALLMPACTSVAVRCARCGGEIQAVPGETYHEEDAPVFERIALALEATVLPEIDLRNITTELSNFAARAAAPRKLLGKLLETVPRLQFLEPGQSREEHEHLAHALGMLLAIVSTRPVAKNSETQP